MEIEKHDHSSTKRSATILAQHFLIQAAAGTVETVAEAVTAVAEAAGPLAEIALIFITLL